MRTTNIALVLLLFANVAHAADHPWRVSVLASEISNERSHPWDDDVHAGVGVAVSYAPAESWDVELSAASQSYTSLYTRLVPYPVPSNGGELVPVSEYRRYRVRPLELTATRRFFAGDRLSPYVRAGVRFVDAPDDDPQPPDHAIQTGFNFSNRTSVEAGVGVRLRLTDRTYLRADIMRLLRADGVVFDPLMRGTAGVTWKF